MNAVQSSRKHLQDKKKPSYLCSVEQAKKGGFV